MKKNLLSLLSLTAILTLGGCSATASVVRADSDGGEIVQSVEPVSIRAKKGSFALYTGDTRKIEVSISPISAYNASLEYASDNPEVATVDENGNIVAVAAGRANITVRSKQNNNVKQDIPVYVADALPMKTITEIQRYTSIINSQAEYQSEHCSRPSKVIANMDYETYIDIDGERANYTVFHRDMLCSEPDGYFSMNTIYEESHVTDGAMSYGSYKYEVLTRPENYQSFLFYTGDSSKNVLFVNTGFLAEEEGMTPYEGVNRILDGLFSTARNIGENNFKYALNTKYLSTIELASTKKGGLYNDNMFIADNAQTGKYTIKSDEESSLEIPAGQQMTMNDYDRYVWIDGYCRHYEINYDWTYEMNDQLYHNVTKIAYKFLINDEVGEVTLPNINDYHVVKHLYEL